MNAGSVNFNTNISDTQDLHGHVVIVYTQWNKQYIDELIKGAQYIFDTHAKKICITYLEVPGCVEIPFAIHAHYAKNQYNQRKADAYIAFGVVIKGETSHFKYVCNSVTDGITQLNVRQNVPTIYGVLTVHTAVQITDRLGGIHGHKGEEAAITALRMIQLNNKL